MPEPTDAAPYENIELSDIINMKDTFYKWGKMEEFKQAQDIVSAIVHAFHEYEKDKDVNKALNIYLKLIPKINDAARKFKHLEQLPFSPREELAEVKGIEMPARSFTP